MNEALQRQIAAQFTDLMKRVRALSARYSTFSVQQIRAQLDAASASFATLARGEMTETKAVDLITKLERALSDVERSIITMTKFAQRNIISGILSAHEQEGSLVAGVLGLDKGAIALQLTTVPAEVQQTMAALRGGATVDEIVAAHVADTSAGITEYIHQAVGVMPSEDAALGIQALLNGDLPVNLGGTTASDLTDAMGLGWKSQRLVVTESYGAYRETNAAALDAAPVQMVAHWETRHDGVVCPICVGIANTDVGYGPGWYLPSQWPANPHPNCRCGQGEIRVINDVPNPEDVSQ